MTRAALTVALALALLAAGCIGTDAPAALDDDAATPADGARNQSGTDAADGVGAPTAPSTGRLVVVARMPDNTLLSGVLVEAANETRTTDGEGRATFAAVPTGTIDVAARKAGHRTALLTAEITAGQETLVEAVLAAEGNDQHAHEDGIFAHRDLYTFEGHFDCSATYVIITGDCLIVVENVTSTAGAPDPVSGTTTERHIIDFPLDLHWETLVVEMTWQPTAPTPATGEGMSLALEPAEAPSDGHAAKYARAEGGSPLRIEMTPGIQHESATTGDMPNPAGGEVIRARAFMTGLAHRPAGTSFLGVGATVQQAFTLHVSIFYEEPAPAGYTAIE